ncbi:MAG: hypothetical protein U0176_08995 [Bacteroidia bacterium]
MKSLRLFLACSLFALIPSLLSAQILLVGTSHNTQTGHYDVVRWNAHTGAVLGTVPTTENGVVMGASAFDAAHGRYYFRGITGLQEVSFNPSQVNSTTLQFDLANAEVDMRLGKLYGLTYDVILDTTGHVVGGHLDFMQYRIADSTETTLLSIPNVAGYLSDASAFDSNHGTYYFMAVDSTVGLSLYRIQTTGSVPTLSTMPLSSAYTHYTLEYDNDSNTLLGFGGTPDSSGYTDHLQVLRMDTLTGATTLVEDLFNLVGYQVASTSYDQATHTMVLIGVDSSFNAGMMGYDVDADSLMALGPIPNQAMEIETDNTLYALAKYQATAIDPALPNIAITLWPQPATDWLEMELPPHTSTVHVCDLQGRELLRSNVLDRLSLQGLSPGMYVLQARSESGALLSSGRFLKMQN